MLVLCLKDISIGSERDTTGAGAVPIFSVGSATAITVSAVAAGAYFLLDPSLAESLLRSALGWAAWTPEASVLEGKPEAMMACTLCLAVGAGR